MFFQLSLPAGQPSQEAPQTLEALSLGAPETLTVEVLTREERSATGQRAHGKLAARDSSAGAHRLQVAATVIAAVTFTP